ncbi:MAG: cysteine hydrolase family protein [Polyangiaceae bacterium]
MASLDMDAGYGNEGPREMELSLGSALEKKPVESTAMTDSLSLDPKTTALLVMDYQTVIVSMAPDAENLLARAGKLLGAARAKGIRVVYVVVQFREGYPEVSEKNQAFGGLKSTGRMIEGKPGTEIHAAVAPKSGEPLVTKRRVGAFSGSDLDCVLRGGGIDTIVLAGISTSGVVLSTLRLAADIDYRIVVVEDCCADPDAEVHRVLTEKIFPRQAKVVKSETILAALA